MTEDHGRRPSGRALATGFFELFAVSGIAIAQPAFDSLGRNTFLFIGRGSRTVDLIALTVIVILVPPVVACMFELTVRAIRPNAALVTHALVIGGFTALAILDALTQVEALTEPLRVGASFAGGAVVSVLVLLVAAARTYLRILAIAPVVFALMFVGFSPVASALRDGGARHAAFVVDRPSRVVVVVFDELPLGSLLDGGGHVDGDLFPNFSRLASTSAWYRNDTTVAPFTDVAVPAILTGRYLSDAHLPAAAANYPNNLFTALRGRYSMNAYESVTRLCPASVCKRTGARAPLTERVQGLVGDTLDLVRDRFDPNPELKPADLAGIFSLDPDPLATGERFVASLRRSPTPRLDFLHVFLPHLAWRYLPSGQDTGETGTPPGLRANAWDGAWSALSGKQQHLLQLQATDRLLGQIIDRLREIHAFDGALVVVTADHGAAFEAGEPLRGVSAKNAAQIAWTPLFIKMPYQTSGRIDDKPARSIDILPTITDAIGLHVPWRFDGTSLLGPRPAVNPRMLGWELDTLASDRGSAFVTIDGKSGFAATLRARDWPSFADQSTRLYRIGPYAKLIGERVASMSPASGSPPEGRIADPARFRAVDPSSRRAPYADVRGTLLRTPPGTPIAVAVNGTIGGLGMTYVDRAGAQSATWWSRVVPTLFRPGSNAITVYVIRGSPSRPALVPVTLAQ
jgi:Sulfatase